MADENADIANAKQPSCSEACVRAHLSSLHCSVEHASRSCEAATSNMALLVVSASRMVRNSAELVTVTAFTVTRSRAMVRRSCAALSDDLLVHSQRLEVGEVGCVGCAHSIRFLISSLNRTPRQLRSR